MRHSSVHLGTAGLDFWVFLGWKWDGLVTRSHLRKGFACLYKYSRGFHLCEDKRWCLWPAAVDASQKPSVQCVQILFQCPSKYRNVTRTETTGKHVLLMLITSPRFYGSQFNPHKPGGCDTAQPPSGCLEEQRYVRDCLICLFFSPKRLEL